MSHQSDRLRGRDAGGNGNSGQDPPPAPANWQEVFAAIEAWMLQAENELRQMRQMAPPPEPKLVIPQVQAPVHIPPPREDRREPLHERFRKQRPPTFEGGTDPLKAEQWLDIVSFVLDFMDVEVNDRVACASHMLRDDACIWWGVVM